MLELVQLRPPSAPYAAFHHRRGGFTLVELLIVTTIIAILASVAIPSYARYVQRSNRSDAQQLMTTIANRETQYLLDARAYTTTLGAGGLNLTTIDGWTCAGAACANDYYTISVTLEAAGFRVDAAPIGNQAGDGALMLRSSGERTRVVSGVDKGW